MSKPLILVLSIPALVNCSGQNINDDFLNSYSFDDIKSYIIEKMESTRTPSISIAVARNGEVIWEESFGWANREKQIKATPQTIYSLASISKPMTATAMMILNERGLINLNEPVDSYLGDKRLSVFEGSAEEATVERLLHHTAGLPTIWNFYFDGMQSGRPPISESINKYGIVTSPPGTVYEYSNLGYGIAEYIIEQVSGDAYPQFMKSEVFEPLGMSRTFVATDKAEYELIAARYLENRNISPFYEVMSRGGGGICSSVQDLVRFGMFHLKNHLPDQKAIISDHTIDYMQSCVDPKVPDSPYKLGWDVKVMHGYRVVNHGGGMPGVTSALLLVPEENLTVAILSNGAYIDLYEIGYRVLVHLLSKGKFEKNQGKGRDKSVDEHGTFLPEKLTGRWEGEIKTDEGVIPIILNIDKTGDVRLNLVESGDTCLPLESFDYKYESLTGSFDFYIPAKDASVSRHRVYLSLKLYDNRLSGYAAAVSYRVEVFHLPYYITLEKDTL